MNNLIKVKNLNTQYSKITVKKTFDEGSSEAYRITKHIVSNQGNYPLAYWINYFTNEF